MMISSLKMLTWFVTRKTELLTAVVLSPFPSHCQLYWLMARTAAQLEQNTKVKDKDMFGVSAIVKCVVLRIVYLNNALLDKYMRSVYFSVT